MAETAPLLHGRRVLVVEDEYLIATDLCDALEKHGAEVIGPAPTVERGLALAASERVLDAAVLDMNLQGERVFPVAEALKARGVPFVFASGYESWLVPEDYRDAPRCEKPVNPAAVARALSKALQH